MLVAGTWVGRWYCQGIFLLPVPTYRLDGKWLGVSIVFPPNIEEDLNEEELKLMVPEAAGQRVIFLHTGKIPKLTIAAWNLSLLCNHTMKSPSREGLPHTPAFALPAAWGRLLWFRLVGMPNFSSITHISRFQILSRRKVREKDPHKILWCRCPWALKLFYFSNHHD